MTPNPIDRLIGLDAVKAGVDEQYKQAKEEADEYLANLRDTVGTTALTSPIFGPEAGEYKYGRSRAKKVVEFNVTDSCELLEWLGDNPTAACSYAAANAQAFGEWWLNETGELPDGVSRVEYEQPSTVTAPKIYRGDREVVMEKLSAHGGLLAGANRLLMEGGDE